MWQWNTIHSRYNSFVCVCACGGAEVSGGFYDLAKAFDCVSHRLLLQNLQYYGIQGEILGWFESYLSNRKQRVELKLLNTQLGTC